MSPFPLSRYGIRAPSLESGTFVSSASTKAEGMLRDLQGWVRKVPLRSFSRKLVLGLRPYRVRKPRQPAQRLTGGGSQAGRLHRKEGLRLVGAWPEALPEAPDPGSSALGEATRWRRAEDRVPSWLPQEKWREYLRGFH